MHDITYAQGILNVCTKEAKGRKVSRIKIELVEDGHFTEDSLRAAFKLISKGTIAEGALLDIKPISNPAVPLEGEFPQSKILELEVEEG